MIPKYCLRCGRENTDNKKVCAFCGYSVLDELETAFPFIRENLLLVASIRLEGASDRETYFDYHQYLEFRKVNPITQAVEFSDKLECIHTMIAAIPYEQFQIMEEEAYGSKEELTREILDSIKSPTQPIVGVQANTGLKLPLEDAWFAFKSWVQGISEAGLDALKLQTDIDSITESREVPIAQFLFKCLIQVDPEFIPEFLAKIERECRFEGEYHRPSLRANLYIVMNAIIPFLMDLDNNEREHFFVKYDEIFRAIADMDADFLFDYMIDASYGCYIDESYGFLLHFLLSKEEYVQYPQFRQLLENDGYLSTDESGGNRKSGVAGVKILRHIDSDSDEDSLSVSNDMRKRRDWDAKEIRKYIALNPSAVQFLEYKKLFTDKDMEVRTAVAQNPNTVKFPEYQALFHDSFWVRRGIVKNKSVTHFPEYKHDYDTLFPAEWGDDLKDILAHPEAVNYPEYELLFSEEGGYFNELLAQTPDAVKFPQFGELFRSILNDGSYIEKKALVLNPEAVKLPEYKSLFTHENPFMRKFVAANTEAVKFIEYIKLFTDPDLTVRQSAAENVKAPSLPEYRRLFTDDGWFIRLAVSKNPNAAVLEGFEQFLAELHPHIRPDRDEEQAKAIIQVQQVIERDWKAIAQNIESEPKNEDLDTEGVKRNIFLGNRLRIDTIMPESLNKPLLEPDYSIIIEIENLIGGILPFRGSREMVREFGSRYRERIPVDSDEQEKQSKWEYDLGKLDFGIMSEDGRIVGLGLDGNVLKYGYYSVDEDFIRECFSDNFRSFDEYEEHFQKTVRIDGDYEQIHYRGKNLSSDPEVLQKVIDKIAQLPHLQSLNLADNGLSTLPDSIGELTELRALNLRKNQLSILPGWIGNLTKLRMLDIGENQFKVLPDSIGDLPELQALNLCWDSERDLISKRLQTKLGSKITIRRSQC